MAFASSCSLGFNTGCPPSRPPLADDCSTVKVPALATYISQGSTHRRMYSSTSLRVPKYISGPRVKRLRCTSFLSSLHARRDGGRFAGAGFFLLTDVPYSVNSTAEPQNINACRPNVPGFASPSTALSAGVGALSRGVRHTPPPAWLTTVAACIGIFSTVQTVEHRTVLEYSTVRVPNP